MAIEYFCCYHSYRRRCEKLTDEELGRLFRALMEYSETGEHRELTGRESIAFDFIADDIDRSKEAYEEKCRKNAENGKAGGRPKNPKNRTVFSETEKSQSKSKSKSKSESNSPNGENTRAKRFTPPTLAEVQSYVAERHSPVDPQGFIDFYAAKGWMVGKTPMKDWKAACRNAEGWDRWNKAKNPAGPYGQIRQPAPEDKLGDMERMKRYLQKQREEASGA